ncbi:hypothetical protein D3C80_1553130 [compost metagenome]
MHVILETPFILERRTETGGFEKLHKARHDATGNVNAAKGAEVQRQIAAEAPQNNAEQRQGAATVDTTVSQCALGNVLRLQLFRQAVIGLDDSAVKIDQPRPGQHSLGRHMAHFSA